MSLETRPPGEASDDAAASQAGALAPDHRDWALVASREIRVKLTDRNFLVSTGITLVLIIGLLGLQAFIAARSGATEYSVVVSSAQGEAIVGQAEAVLQAQEDDASVSVTRVGDAAAGEALVTEGDADGALTQRQGGWTLLSDGGGPAELERALADAVRQAALTANAEAAGTSVPELLSGAELTTEDVSGEDAAEEVVQIVAGILFGVLFYMASLTYGISIANSVVEEKQSRIVEILAAVIPVRALLTGKVLGNTLLAFGQMALLVGVSLIGLSFTEFDRFLPMMTEPLLWYLPFFVAGFVALACMWAAAGALASRTEDLQSTTLPLTLTLVLVFVVALNLEGAARTAGSFVPVMSTILMPMRLLEGGVGWWEPVAALAATVVFGYLTILVGSTLYRRALMQTQGRVTLRQAMRLKG
ncbi:MAG TPA: ABC transporter permease [Ornithinimicrobium sp.]|uniref:ABC transporter permease n=1 Tax=Ornithinimicrobium sp. TaxID=1977084 RepID=UPI002B49E09A|nr:ABC transporter permease [Ornithinimicrobium sp.]HKJ11473.1 ABC transporter permease [Ornithinimicrobium sp.]